jgi:acetolactate decarboxylase
MRHFSIFFLFLINILHANAQIEVKAISAMKPVMMGIDLSAHVSLDTIASLPNLFAVCPLGRLEGEITILDGKIYKSRVGKKNKIITDNEFRGTAPFMVYAQVEKWQAFEIDATILSEHDLQEFIQDIALTNGFDTSRAFPFLIKAQFDTVRYHIISKPLKEKKHDHSLHNKAKKHFEQVNQVGTVLGFYSRHHEGVFTHRGSYTHAHFVDEKETVNGHIETLIVRSKNLTVFLPVSKD